MNAWPPKDPDEILDYQFDWSARLVAPEVISSSTMIKASGSVTLSADGFASPITSVWMTGGTAGDVCIVTNRIVTSQGRTHEASAKVRIRSTSP